MSATYLDVSNTLDRNNLPFISSLSSDAGISMEQMMEELDDEIVEEMPKIKIGICAMNKKTKSQPMQEILSRMIRFDFIEIIVFPDDVIIDKPIEDWPLCDALISFYSSGFPLNKAIKYAELRKPFVFNDLEMQFTLLDRCAVYSLLESANIEMPRYATLLRDKDGNPVDTDFVELEDSIQIGNVVFQKPFVEKPVNAEDHNVFIYFPSSAGGGSQRLFRKVGSRSSVYSAESSVRKFGSYIYEDFVHTDGTDVKIYTVGPEYAHAEARKSPSLDGKVERDSQGKEIRYPVILNPYEKEIAHKVCKLFKQTVCGFDLLRTHGKSYVCDVNGFSFVKTSKKYYDDCAQVLVNCCLQQLAPRLYKPYNIELDTEDHGTMPETLDGTMLELRCVVGIIRHGDRTPKQKLKMEVRHFRFLELFKKYNKSTDKKLKLKQPKQLQEVLDIARYMLEEIEANPETSMFEKPNKLRQLKNVLEMYGHFSGINRKIQLKYLGKVKDSSENSGGEEKQSKQSTDSESEKSLKVKERDSKEEALLLIMKWGGELTQAGRVQAEELGKAFRCIYPGGDGDYSSLPGCGLLRLHSTYRHDLKIYASDEGRVQMTAAAFAKGFLALEGELTPILVHLVRSDKGTTEMLDTSDQATKFMAKYGIYKVNDIQHNSRLGLHSTEELYDCSKALADIVIPQEYGITAEEKVKISQTICQRLLRKINGDLKAADVTDTTTTRLNPKYSQSVISPHRHVRTRLYFTSESHVHSVVNSIRYGNLIDVDKADEQWNRALEFLGEIPELNYMTQLVLMLYEDPTAEVGSDNRFHIELHFSPGAYTQDEKKHHQIRGKSAHPKPSRPFSEENEETTGQTDTTERQTDTTERQTDATERQTDTQGNSTLSSQVTKITDTGDSHDEQPEEESNSSLKEEKGEENLKTEEHGTEESKETSKVDGSNLEQTAEKPYESTLYTDDKTYDGNEQSRCAIGMDDFTDPTGSPIQSDIQYELSHEEKTEQNEGQDKIPSEEPLRRRHSGHDTFVSHRQTFSRTSSESDAVPFGIIEKLHSRQTLSENNIFVQHQPTSHHQPTSRTKGSQSDDTFHQHPDNIKEENESDHGNDLKPKLIRARSQSTSCIEGTPEYDEGRGERSASDSSSNDSQRVTSTAGSAKSDSLVLDKRKEKDAKNLRVIKSSPIMKKSPVRRHHMSTAWRHSSPESLFQDQKRGTLIYLPSIRAVSKKLSLAKHGPCRIRPLAPLSVDPKKPPLAEFYDQILSPIASIYPLLTLHNSIPLNIMESFLDRLTEEKSGESDVSSASTPATTPTRKHPTKRLSLKSSTHEQVLANNDSIVSFEGLDLIEFKS
ncbi:inositol hexakisphosphate and diphosphoinositol-pentakisphosphate kinase 2-like [Actinia tenebrosa]|uniref:Inositol hexakisphosphate and diphosphoinositol-pentakisphosphate kinase n=1 Tax=Actinia tenebrosa TaxID=6105 RepID=A0A6P8HUN1_ACTTE|nr:inositol hexakisphosphate and diphosphoinositol-pentakisphosphate kinase 2-like [Actinia tenebrosa]